MLELLADFEVLPVRTGQLQALHLPNSCADILTQRRQAFASLAVILRQRDELLQIQVDTLSGMASPDLKEDEISLVHTRVGFL